MKEFIPEWNKRVQDKKSLICAGLDPAPYEMGRGEKGLPKEVDLEEWCFNYVNAVSDYSCAVKYNTKYWSDEKILKKVIAFAKKQGLLVIEDSKLADITETNEAGIYKAKTRGADAVTLAPFAGNMRQSVESSKKYEMAVFGMCLMSNPEFAVEKNLPTPLIGDSVKVFPGKTFLCNGNSAVRRFEALAFDIYLSEGEGAVIGSTSHILEEELSSAAKILGPDKLILSPGFGSQGGSLDRLVKFFKTSNLLINSSRALMFPKGSQSSPEDQKKAARDTHSSISNFLSR